MRTVIIIGLLLLGNMVYAQEFQSVYITRRPVASTPPEDTIVAEDNFQLLTNGSINSQGEWTVGYGGVLVSTAVDGDKRVGSNNASNSIAYHSATLNASMACEMVVDSTQGGRGLGPAVNVDGDDCYGIYSTTTGSYLVKVVNGSESTLDTGTAWVKGDIIQVWRYGNSLYVYKNGSLDSSIGTGGIQALSAPYLAGTKAGMVGWGAAGWGLADNWKAWNVSW